MTTWLSFRRTDRTTLGLIGLAFVVGCGDGGSTRRGNNGGSGGVSIEGWARVTGNQDWSRYFDFGSTDIGGGVGGELTGPFERFAPLFKERSELPSGEYEFDYAIRDQVARGELVIWGRRGVLESAHAFRTPR